MVDAVPWRQRTSTDALALLDNEPELPLFTDLEQYLALFSLSHNHNYTNLSGTFYSRALVVSFILILIRIRVRHSFRVLHSSNR